VNHAVVTEHLADYLEGDLALDLRALVDAHLDGCEICSQEVREMQQTIRLLRTLPEPETPPLIAANVMRRIRAGETTPSVFERISRALGGALEPSFVLPASALAVAALVVFVVQEGGSLRGAFERSAGSAAGSADSEPALAATAANGSGLSQFGRGDSLDAESRGIDAGELEREFGAPVAEERMAMPAPSAGQFAQAERPLAAATDRLEQVASADAAHAASDSASVSLETDASEPVQNASEDSRWAARSQEAARPRARSGDRGIFGDPALAQGFATTVSGPGNGEPSLRGVEGRSARMGASLPLTLTRSGRAGAGLQSDESAGGEDPRDVWLARALEEPVQFARYIAGHNLAEQEIWVERLAERAAARGLLGEVVTALRAAGDEKAGWLAEDFAAEGAAQEAGAAPAAEDSPNGAREPESID
jgi:Putative zinc-finger